MPGSNGAMVLLASVASPFGTTAGVTTDVRGRAVALVRNGLTAGTGSVRILIPEFGFETGVSYTIIPGAPASLFVRDTTLDVAERIAPLGVARDRGRNEILVPPGSLTLTGGAPKVLAQGGEIEGAIAGIGRVRAGFAGVDTAFNARVVPPGRIGMAGLSGKWFALRTNGVADDPVTIPVTPFTANASPLTGEVVMDDDQIIGSQLRVLDPATGSVRLLTATDSRHLIQLYPKYSFDGSWIYYAGRSGDDGRWRVWKVRADGQDDQIVPGLPLDRVAPALSPDGMTLAVVEVNPANDVLEIRSAVTGVVLASASPAHYPVWSPDGKWIAYLNTSTLKIHVMRPDGSGNSSPSSMIASFGFQWSPDSKWIIARLDGSPWILGADGSALTDVPVAFASASPVWFPR